MRKAGRFNPEKFSQLITPNFPPVKFAFGYGSAFFQQKNYQYDKKQPVFDIIFVVEDRVDWHKDNMTNNRKHYGGLSYVFGPKFINFIQNALCPIHYNPFVMLDEYKIKYGVISEKDFKRDLLRWETLIVSGRMHKPVQKLIENEDYSEIIQKNLQSAVAAALLVDGRTSIHDKELFMNIASLSYLGDIRFTLKGENKDKIANIVEGQYDQLRELYHPILKAAPFKDIVKVHDENFLFPKYTPESRHALIEMLPRGFGSEFVGENMDFKQSLMMRKDEQRDIIKEVISDLNSKNSRNMLLYHLLTVSPLKNAVYALEKLKKGRAKNP